MAIDTSALIQLLCATFIESDRAAELRQAAAEFQDWGSFLGEATHHRLLPLAYWTFKRYEIETPRSVRQIMAGAYLRQKSIARAQNAALLQALCAFSEQGIEAVVLKGGILAPLLYPEPGLRPMEDLDILVAPARCEQARQILLSLGYFAPPASSRYDRLSHHLPGAQREDSGHTVCIELHREVFTPILNCPLDFSHLDRPFAQFLVDGVNVAHLGDANLLQMQYRGLRKLAEPLRKLQLVDLALLAQRLPDHGQGPALRVRQPELWNALVALDRYLPLNQRTRQLLGLPPPIVVNTPCEDYTGWPRPLLPRQLADWAQTVWPSRWWAEFFYGLPPNSSRLKIQRAHWGLFLQQGWLRLQLGRVDHNSFFSHKPIEHPIPPIPWSMAPTSEPAAFPVPAEPTVLVTCIYNGLSGTRYGGRRNRDELYRDSLATIARSCGLPVLCFAPAAAIPAHQEFFEGRPNEIAWEPLELDEIPHSREIQRIKSDRPERYAAYEWQERCVEVMWGKFHMLKQALEWYPAAEHLFWIDAGLANVNVISTKYTDREALQAGDLHRVDAAFVPELFVRMEEMAGERLLAIQTTVAHHPGIPEKYNDRPYENGHGVIAGLFGGKRNVVQAVCRVFEEKCQKLLADDVLYFEESILTGIFADHPDLFVTFTFDTWYHEGWDYHDPSLVNFSQFFDLLLNTPTPSEPLKCPWSL